MDNQPFQPTNAEQRDNGPSNPQMQAPNNASDTQQAQGGQAPATPQVIVVHHTPQDSRTHRRFNPWLFMAISGFVIFAVVAGVGLTMLANVQSGVHQNGQLLASTQSKLSGISQALTDMRAQLTQISQQIASFFANIVSLLSHHAA